MDKQEAEAIRNLVSLCIEFRAYVPEGAPELRRFIPAISNEVVSLAHKEVA